MSAEVSDFAVASVARWCSLSVDNFGQIYRKCTANTGAEDWAALFAMHSDSLQLREACCQEALRLDLLGEFALKLAKVQVVLGLGSDKDADTMMRLIVDSGAAGRMQALVSDGGLLTRNTLLGTLSIDAATAMVYRGDQVVGTAFLVGPDLIMTAAHVVLRTEGIEFKPRLENRLSFSFRPAGGGRDAVFAYPAARMPLVLHSLPFGHAPDTLSETPPEVSAQCLDYALVRLDREVRHVEALDIRSPPRVSENDPVVVLGYPGGTAMRWDKGPVKEVGGERIHHMVNTLPGMSGSCCINVHGRPVAVHEGSLQTKKFAIGGKGPACGVNRAVGLWVIRNHMLSGADPLMERPRSPALEFQSDEMVRRMGRAGLRLVGGDPQASATWKNIVEKAVGVLPGAVGVAKPFHPWFKRGQFEEWVDANAVPGASRKRLCIVSGPPGCGKTFLASILRERVPDDLKDTVVISATETTAWSWSEAIHNWGVETGNGEPLRPAPGVAMHDEAPAAAKLFAHLGGHTQDGPPLFVLIDFDGNASFPEGEEAPWLPFMFELLGYPWVRLVVIGAPSSVSLALMEHVQDNEVGEYARVNLDHIAGDEFSLYIRQLLRAGRDTVPEQALKDAMAMRADLLREMPAPQALTAVTALAAIVVRNGLGG